MTIDGRELARFLHLGDLPDGGGLAPPQKTVPVPGRWG